MLGRWLTLFGVYVVISCPNGFAQDGPQPTLGLVFPLAQTKDEVHLSKSLWISSALVLPKGSRLFTIYTMPRGADANMPRKDGQINFQRATAARRGLSPSDESITDALRQKADRTVWRDINQFRAIMQAVDRRREDAVIVFRTPGEKENRHLGLNFPEGTLWSEADGIITALWIRPASASERLGVTQGSLLLAVNGKSINNLSQAAKIWNTTNQSGTTSKSWLISHAGNKRLIEFGPFPGFQKSAIDSW